MVSGPLRQENPQVGTPGVITNYGAAHNRLRRIRGPASGYTCGCGRPAQDWAYLGGDPDERVCTKFGLVFSANLDRYVAMCRSCHHRLDKRKPQCVNGHDLTPENIYTRPNGARNCRKCHREQNRKRMRKYSARKKAQHDDP